MTADEIRNALRKAVADRAAAEARIDELIATARDTPGISMVEVAKLLGVTRDALYKRLGRCDRAV